MKFTPCLNLKFILLSLQFFTSAMTVLCQTEIQWQKSLGGTELDEAYSIQETFEGGYIVTGKTNSNDVNVSGNNGNQDFWVVKLNSLGDLEWQKCLIDDVFEVAYSIRQTTDGGYIVAGTIDNGSFDYSVIKLDPLGEVVWSKAYGGSQGESAFGILQTNDGGYIVAGESGSSDGDVSENKGAFDTWIVKLDDEGNIEWEKSFGGSGDDRANAIRITDDGGFIVAGQTFSNDGDVEENFGINDFWIIQLDSSGNLLWEKSYGGSLLDEAMTIEITYDGGFIVAGYTYSNDFNVSLNHGSQDAWIIKLDNIGNIEWQKSLGGTGDEIVFSIAPTSLGYIIAGGTNSNDNDVTGNHGLWDYWIIKLNDAGNIIWQQTFGGSNFDVAFSIQQTLDEGFVVAGYSNSEDGDITEPLGGRDFWVVKLSSSTTIEENTTDKKLNVYPNPATSFIHYHADGVTSWDGIEIINSYGSIVKSFTDKSHNCLEVHGLPAGLYLIRFIQSNSYLIRKFFIQ